MNRFKFEASDIRKVQDHLQSGASITKNDIGLPKWAHRLKKPSVRKVAHGASRCSRGSCRSCRWSAWTRSCAISCWTPGLTYL